MLEKKIPDLDPAGAITGDEQLELVQGSGSVKSTVNAIKNGAVKVYRALLSQSGTDAPVAVVLENTLGGVPIYSRSSSGVYAATLSGAFPLGKTVVRASVDFWNSNCYYIGVGLKDDSNIDIESRRFDASPSDLGDGYSVLEVLVYP